MIYQVELVFSIKNDTLFVIGVEPQDLITDVRPGMVLRRKQNTVEAIINGIEYIDRPEGVLVGLTIRKENEITWSRVKTLAQGDQIILE
ncbi:hypothetical protein [Fibrella aestuarina]|uniref:hypothetical protein n=1 Tax=Fibrella aestuarina TaxID=651143 RepID=UPI00059CD4B6|nr:hypothetical protein [Fibrella aestuarina]